MAKLWNENYVVVNEFSRPGIKLEKVSGIVMHWTANPGASDENHQKYFDGADGGGGRYASAHLFADRDSATLIIPLDEVAYQANDKPCKVAKLGSNANYTSIGIEMCVESDGTIHPETVARCEAIAAELCVTYGLDPAVDIYRHYDVTGKNCPAPWVSDVSKFNQFKNNVSALVGGGSVVQPEIPKPPVQVNIEQLAQDVINGKYGSGEERKVALGSNYDAVQKRVNEILGATTSQPETPKPQVNIDQLAQAVINGDYGSGDARRQTLGSNYDAVQKRVNEILGGGASQPQQKSTNQLAQEVINGYHGTGRERMLSLGSRYNEVQAEVNRILRG